MGGLVVVLEECRLEAGEMVTCLGMCEEVYRTKEMLHIALNSLCC